MSKANHESRHSQLFAVSVCMFNRRGESVKILNLQSFPNTLLLYVSRWRRSRAFIRACGALRKQEEVLKRGQQPNLARPYRLNYG